MYARVIVDIQASQVDRVFDYAIPPAYEGRVLPGTRVSVPFGSRRGVEGFVVALTEETQVPLSRIRPLNRLLDPEPVLLPAMLDLAYWVRDTYHCLLVDALRLMLPAEMRGGRVREKTETWISLGDLPAWEEVEGLLARSPALLRALRLLREEGGTLPLPKLRQVSPLSAGQLDKLTARGWVRLEEVSCRRRPYTRIVGEEGGPPPATHDQERAVAAVCQAIDRGRGAFLLHGVTGSGKTEVYMRCAQHALDEGKGVLILVPEIALTPQMVARFTGRFGSRAAVLHSRLSAGERYDEWRRIRRGEAQVVIGARSAVFAPLAEPGLIVVDEEHENSYRSEHTPRYDAVEVARRRADSEGAVLLAGSATPSVARYHEALAGRYTLLTMPWRIGGRPMPPVAVVDMREELLHGNRSMFSGRLVSELHRCLQAGEQAILFMNRRGYASFVSCRACGYVVKCQDCDLSMTYHKHGERLICHYCGREQPAPQVCPACGSRAIKQFGGGTERIQEEVLRHFPEARVLRMDADTTRGKEGHLPILEAFGRGEAQVLVGTQMVAKGLDFPRVTLVGVVAADMSLYSSDYRAAERTFDLIAQVAGRAGRSERPGTVVVQTYAPEHPSIQAAARHDYEGFYQGEIQGRELAQLPPFANFYRLMLQHERPETADGDLEELSRRLDALLQEHPQWQERILLRQGGTAPVERIRGVSRRQILIKAAAIPLMAEAEAALAALAREPLPGNSVIWLEVNPVNML